MSSIADRIKEINASLPQGTRLVAVSKFHPVEAIQEAYDAGHRLFGENKVQELVAKKDLLPSDISWHFIGHLQTNKVRVVAGRAGLIHSVDSVRLAAEIDSRCRKLGVTQDILVEINIGEEESKTGVEPDRFDDFLAEIEPFSAIRAVGIMTMAPKCEKLEDFRAYFRKSYQFYLDFSAKKLHNIGEPVLSMGMSDSYECAIEEGATLVRVGSAIFGARHYQ